jgi:hypothetical protein
LRTIRCFAQGIDDGRMALAHLGVALVQTLIERRDGRLVLHHHQDLDFLVSRVSVDVPLQSGREPAGLRLRGETQAGGRRERDRNQSTSKHGAFLLGDAGLAWGERTGSTGRA